MKSPLTDISSLELSRKEFLLKTGLLFLTVTGLAALLRATLLPELPTLSSRSDKGFGSGSYGG